MAYILRVPNTSNYVADASAMKFGYRYEAEKYGDYDGAFIAAMDVMDKKDSIYLEIEEVPS